jgi:hypothetical protein
MRAALLASGILAAGCTELPTSGGASAVGQAPIGSQQGQFTKYPARLFSATAAFCDQPG